MHGVGDAERHAGELGLVLPGDLEDLDAMVCANHGLRLPRARGRG